MRIFQSARRAAWGLILIAACGSPVYGADKRVKLTGETCDYILTYNPSKVSEAQVKDTFALLLTPQNQVFGAIVFSVEAMKAVDIGKIERDCAQSLDKIRAMQLAPLDGIESYRTAVIAETEDSCRFDRIDARGFAEPSALREYRPAAACDKYVDALEGKSDLTAMFSRLVHDKCKNNSDVRACVARANKAFDNVDAMKLDVHNFGWGNCANAFTLRNTADNDARTQKLATAFLKAYRARQVNCEAP